MLRPRRQTHVRTLLLSRVHALFDRHQLVLPVPFHQENLTGVERLYDSIDAFDAKARGDRSKFVYVKEVLPCSFSLPMKGLAETIALTFKQPEIIRVRVTAVW